jgi:hypothetical protein
MADPMPHQKRWNEKELPRVVYLLQLKEIPMETR